MANKAPGKRYRQGMTLPQLFKMFPDDRTAAAWVESMAGRPVLPALRKPQRAAFGRAKDDHSPLQTLPEMVQRPHRLDHAIVEARYADLGHCRLSAQCQPRRPVELEAASGTGDHAEDRVASGAPHPRSMGRQWRRHVPRPGGGGRGPRRGIFALGENALR